MNEIAKILEADLPFVYVCAGGGSLALSEIATTPGSSAVLLGAHMLQSRQAAIDFLGLEPQQYCSGNTARFMAMQAFQQARRSGGKLGVGCTCALATTRPKKGDHRFHIALQMKDRTLSHSFVLKKGQFTRIEEESIVKTAVLRAIAAASTSKGLEGWQNYSFTSDIAKPYCDAVLMGDKDFAYLNDEQLPEKPVIFPGSFNPAHKGHFQMAEVAKEITGHQVIFELSIRNADKPPLDFHEIQRRVAVFDERPFLITDAPLFVDKARIFPNATFVCGVDTIARLIDPKYYLRDKSFSHPESIEFVGRTMLVEQSSTFATHNVSFLVFARCLDGKVKTLDDLHLPEHFQKRCRAVPPEKFRIDIASTDLRVKDCNDCGESETDCRCQSPDA